MNSTSPYSLEAPCVSWREGDLPYSDTFDDIFYPSGSAPEISQYVFCEPNNLPDAWRNKRNFAIGELGFGTGLNFFVTWELWKQSPASDGWLHFVSFEKAPLPTELICKALSRWNVFDPFLSQFLKQYPPALPGVHRLEFPEDRVRLDLHLGEAQDMLERFQGHLDAWYLDGFSPSKNPSLWNSEIFSLTAQHSRDGTTLGTYSSAGHVRRGLEQVGFEVTKFPGTKGKRESIRAVFRSEPSPAVSAPGSVAVIGGGLAGTSIAHALTQRNIEVTLVEREASIATRASGNPRGVLLPYIRHTPAPMSRLYLTGYLHSLRLIQKLIDLGADIPFDNPGIVHFASTERLQKLLESLPTLGLAADIAQVIEQDEASKRVGHKVTQRAFWYPEGAWVSPPALCKTLLGSKTEVLSNFKAITLSYNQNSWTVTTSQGRHISAEKVVIANAYESQHLTQSNWLPVEPVRGQLLELPETSSSKQLRSILCYDGYCTPAFDGKHLVGATYEHKNYSNKSTETESIDLVSRLKKWCPELALTDPLMGSPRVSFRTSTFDRMPFVGAIPHYGTQPTHHGLYAMLGFGSRGLISCPLAAEFLASELCGEPLPLERDLVESIAPQRYLNHLSKKKELAA